jgi:hypothetical protein
MCIVMGADTASNSQPAASPGRNTQAKDLQFVVDKHSLDGLLKFPLVNVPSLRTLLLYFSLLSIRFMA